MTDIWTYLKNSGRPIAIFGTGNGADKVIDRLAADGLKPAAVFASDGFVRGRYFRGLRVESFDSVIRRLGAGITVLMCFGSKRPEVLENVKKISSVCELLAPDVPVCGNEIFDMDFFNAHKEKIDAARTLLSDETSIRTFDDIIKFKLTGRIDLLYSCESREEDADRLIVLPSGAEIFDLGAYNGDTAIKFTELFPDRGTITAVEPEKTCFAKLIKNTEQISGIKCINALVSGKDGTAFFDRGKRGRGGSEAADGIPTPCVTVDSLCENGADLIKFDIEGNELAAIEGGKRTIINYRPRMIVSCYHKSEDIFLIPLKIHKLRSDYNIYLRHFTHIPAWDTQYYFI